MSWVEDEIASQPQLWRRAVELAPEVSASLPADGARVAVVGCGTSLYMARAWAVIRESLGHGETDAFAASEFPADRRYDHVVAITRSGTTTEVLRLLESVRGQVRTTVLTTGTPLPAASLADATVVLDFADEQSVVQTRFATTALALLRASVGDDLEPAIAQAAQVVARPTPEPTATQFTFLGTGWSVGIAEEAALKVREAAQAWAESYPAMEYRHGPISIASPVSQVWVFGRVPEGLVDQIEATGAAVVTSSDDPMAHLIGAQRLAVALATTRGLDPDAPRNLTRSIVLTDG